MLSVFSLCPLTGTKSYALIAAAAMELVCIVIFKKNGSVCSALYSKVGYSVVQSSQLQVDVTSGRGSLHWTFHSIVSTAVEG